MRNVSSLAFSARCLILCNGTIHDYNAFLGRGSNWWTQRLMHVMSGPMWPCVPLHQEELPPLTQQGPEGLQQYTICTTCVPAFARLMLQYTFAGDLCRQSESAPGMPHDRIYSSNLRHVRNHQFGLLRVDVKCIVVLDITP